MKDPLQQLLESAGMKFAGEPEQKVADQVRGTETATSNGEQHPFHDRLVGEASTLEDVLMKKYQAMKEKDEKETEEPAQQAAIAIAKKKEQGVTEEMPPVAPAGSPAATGAAPAPTTPVTLSGPEAAAAETAALEKIKTNAGLKGQFDALAKRAQVTPTTTGADPIETATIEKIKANSGLKNQYNKLMQMAQQQPGAKV